MTSYFSVIPEPEKPDPVTHTYNEFINYWQNGRNRFNNRVIKFNGIANKGEAGDFHN
jgi:hypothetical protein